MGTNSPTSTTLEIGASIGGCVISRLIGRGGMGAVYEGQQVALERRVAVKVLRLDICGGDPSLREQFIKEARLAARLNHPNIVQIFNVGQEADVDFIIMEYVEGATFKEILKKQPQLQFSRLVRVLQKVSRGLAAAHKEKVVHRDIKPENIMATSTGEIKITDFGAASLAVNVENPQENIIGTPLYMAPEVISRQNFDGRADIYALGLMLYTAAMGSHPIQHREVKLILKAQMFQPLPALKELRPDLPARFVKLLERMCSKNPHERCTADEILQLLDGNPDWDKGDEKAMFAGLPEAKPETPGSPPINMSGESKKSILNARLLKSRQGDGTLPPSEAPSEKMRTEAEFWKKKNPERGGYDSRKLQEKIAAAASASKSDPRVNELCVLARFHFMKRELQLSEDLFKQALAGDPESEMALMGLARLYTDLDRHREAIEQLRKILQKGNCEPRVILESSHFKPLRGLQEFQSLLAEFSI